jgi:DNA-directed RNA polymerase
MSFDDEGFGGRGGRGGGYGGRGGGRSGGFGRGGYGGGDREMHKAVCSDCGKECEVPFKPTEGRPVYCRDCFPKHKKF